MINTPPTPGLDGQMVSAVDRKGAMDDVHRLTFILAPWRLWGTTATH